MDALRSVYFAYFQSLLKYCIIFWGNSSYISKVFLLQKRFITIMKGTGWRCSCRGIFKNLNILTVPCLYIFSLMIFVVDNIDEFITNFTIHGISTRNQHQLYRPMMNLSCIQNGTYYTSITIFNKLPSHI
jgi:hypothetical protein